MTDQTPTNAELATFIDDVHELLNNGWTAAEWQGPLDLFDTLSIVEQRLRQFDQTTEVHDG